MPTREVVVNSGSGLVQTILIGPHQLVADERVESGGKDVGPGPYELLLAALGASTSMTLRAFADGKDWPVKQVTVRCEHWKVQATGGNGGRQAVDEIKKVILLEGALSNVQRNRLLEVADTCPVHRTLARTVRICTVLGTEDA